MNWFSGLFLGAFTLASAMLFSLFYLAIKKYAETLAKLSAEDYYKAK